MSVQKILFVSVFKEGEGGGEGAVAYEMARWFSKYYQVIMLCPGAATGLTVDERGFHRYCVESTGERNMVVPLLSMVNVRKIYNFLDEFKPDVVHIHDPVLLGVIVQMWAQLRRIPIFFTSHVIPSRALDFGVTEASRLASIPINEIIAEHYLLAFLQNCDAVVALNEITAEEIRESGYLGPLAIIPNGRDLSLYHRCKLADVQEKPYILTFIGFLSRRKNQAFLLEVMKHLPEDYHLQLIGEAIVPSYRKELESIVQESRRKVIFTGQLTQEQIARALEQTHVFVSASKLEVQSLVVIEALASGTPVVGLSNETIDEMVDSSNGVCLPKDAAPQEFADAVEKLCGLPEEEYNRLCEAARLRVDHLDWSNVMEKTVHTYELILAEKGEVAETIDDHEVLKRYLSYFPEGAIRKELTVSSLTSPSAPLPACR